MLVRNQMENVAYKQLHLFVSLLQDKSDTRKSIERRKDKDLDVEENPVGHLHKKLWCFK